MDGPWYRWGFKHSSPIAFVAAWRHIHEIFASAEARNVIWTWTISRVSRWTSPLRKWWPGNRYVSWIGIDGYYRKPQTTFTWLFRKTLRDVRDLTHSPILVTETSVTRTGPQASQIKNLFQAARRSGLFGVIWFNINAMQEWTLVGRPPAVLAEFRRAAENFTN
jgi:beta-mannanase